jgi:ribose-phosphate pyrophosphokinase
MTTPLIVALPGNEGLAVDLARGLGAELAETEFRRFPDGESYVRLDTEVTGRSVLLACTLDQPDEKFLTLMFSAVNARDLGAARVGLVSPYLAYMRQDKRFRPGEAVTSALFAGLLSAGLDWLVTIDPHLHRVSTLDAIYPIETRVLHAAPLVARWIVEHVSQPLLIGPDAESEQWVGTIAAECGAPHIVLEKRRRGDRAVEISVPDMRRFQDRTPVLVDDIISSARTMIEALSHLRTADMKPAICVGVHAVFATKAYGELRAAGGERIATTNTIRHETNDIDVTPLLVDAVRTLA